MMTRSVTAGAVPLSTKFRTVSSVSGCSRKEIMKNVVQKIHKSNCFSISLPAELPYKRYKFVVQAVIGEQRGSGVKLTSRCLWDLDTDNYSSDVFLNVSSVLNILTKLNFFKRLNSLKETTKAVHKSCIPDALILFFLSCRTRCTALLSSSESTFTDTALEAPFGISVYVNTRDFFFYTHSRQFSVRNTTKCLQKKF